MNQKWAVIGGGILGMTLAHRLARQGHSVTLFEKSDHLGGLAASMRLGPITWDRYYHVILLSDRHTRALLAEVDLEKDIQWVETRTGFYTDGALVSMSNILEFLRFPPLNIVDKIRLGITILYASRLRNWLALEKILATDWLRRLSGRHTFTKIWLPLLRAKLGENYRIASAAFIWATIARMSAARKSGLKKEMFGYVPGGYGRINNALKVLLTDDGVDVKLSAALEVIHYAESDSQIAIGYSGRSEKFDRVVCTIPNPIITRCLPQLTGPEKARLAKVIYQGIVCVALLLKEPLSHYYITNITESWVPFTAVIEMSALVDTAQFGGSHLVYLPKYAPGTDPIFTLADTDIISQFLRALGKMYKHFAEKDVLAATVSRASVVFPISTIDYTQIMPRITTSIPGVYIVNSSQVPNGTLNVNETICLANNAVEKLS